MLKSRSCGPKKSNPDLARSDCARSRCARESFQSESSRIKRSRDFRAQPGQKIVATNFVQAKHFRRTISRPQVPRIFALALSTVSYVQSWRLRKLTAVSTGQSMIGCPVFHFVNLQLAMIHNDVKSLSSFLRKEVNNYIGTLPKQLREGTADASDCALRIGKLLNWISSSLDSGEFPKQHPLSILALSEDFQRVGLELCDAKARGRLPNPNAETLIRLRTVIDDLHDLERSATHVLNHERKECNVQ